DDPFRRPAGSSPEGRSDCGIDSRPCLLHRLQIEPHRGELITGDLEYGHAAHQVWCTIEPCAAHLPLGPDAVALARAGDHIGLEVRNSRKDLGPVPPDLVASTERTCWVCRSFVHKVRRKAADQPVEVVTIDCIV